MVERIPDDQVQRVALAALVLPTLGGWARPGPELISRNGWLLAHELEHGVDSREWVRRVFRLGGGLTTDVADPTVVDAAPVGRDTAGAGEHGVIGDEVVTLISRELRTPLTPIVGFLGPLEEFGDGLTADQQQMVRIAARNARRMVRLVDDLLVTGKVRSGTLLPQPDEVCLARVVRRVLVELGLGGAEIEVDVDPNEYLVTVDPSHLERVLTHLVSNAVSHGATPITLSASTAGEGRIAIEVVDRGPGVSGAFAETMWEPFTQQERGDTRSSSGAGLGLAIVRSLVECNGGQVAYRPATPAGAVFSVELPGAAV